VAVLLKKIEQGLIDTNDTDNKLVLLVKIIRLQKHFVLDPENSISLIKKLCMIIFNIEEELFSLVKKAEHHLFRLFPPGEVGKQEKESVENNNTDEPDIDDLLYQSQSLLSRECPDFTRLNFALAIIREYGNEEFLNVVEKFLKHNEATIRYAALECYGKHGGISQISRFIAHVADPDRRVRMLTAILLRKAGFEQVCQVLHKMLESSDPALVTASVFSLSHIATCEEVVELLLSATNERFPTKIRSMAVAALTWHQHPKITRRLEELNNDLDIDICELAAKSLEKNRKKIKKELLRIWQ
jgi:hypothetical protein